MLNQVRMKLGHGISHESFKYNCRSVPKSIDMPKLLVGANEVIEERSHSEIPGIHTTLNSRREFPRIS